MSGRLHTGAHWGRRHAEHAATRFVLLAIVAAHHGRAAAARVLHDLGADLPAPVVLVLHPPAGTPRAIEESILRKSPLPVREATTAARPPMPGTVYVAPADHHLSASAAGIRAEAAPPERFHRPCGDLLFRSVARHTGHRTIGVLLGGMGDDGADGLRALRDAGGFTIVEDPETAAASDMPRAGIRRGAAEEVLPSEAIGARIRELLGARASPRALRSRA